MKRSLLLGILSMGVGVAASYGQGYILLSNYSSTATTIQYGAGVPANGASGALGIVGGPLSNAWTVGLYWVAGSTGLSEAAGTGMPDASLGLGAGGGATTQIASANAGGNPGYYASLPSFNSGSTLNTTLTLEIVVYPTAAGSYASALYRIHSAAFSMATATASNPIQPLTGNSMPGTLEVAPVPEPTTLALSGLGGLALLLMRRKKA